MSIREFQSVLYVDDDPDICEVVRATLCLTAGLDVRTAGSGEQAIDLAYELRPDLVLMDVMMPGLDGPSTFRRMRESDQLADIPVIFMTAKVLPAEVAHFLQLGAIGVIGKPFDPLKLCDDLFALWKNAQAARRGAIANGVESQVRAQVNSLTGSFLERARADIVHIREMIERARDGDQSALKDVERLAHSIHGAGAMFGFSEMSAAGGAIERLTEALRANIVVRGSISEPAAFQQLLDCNEKLAQEVEAAGQATPHSGAMFQGPGGGK
jgi:two-component system, OmpR family, response regulator